MFGSFGNVVILRGIAGDSLGGRSKCTFCSRTLHVLELIPVISFLVLRARCRTCQSAISWQYPLVETASGLLFLVAFWHDSSVLAAGLLALCLWLLLIMSIIDARTGMIADALSIPLILVALLRAFLLGQFPLAAVIAGVAFFGLQWIVSRGRWVGSGDIVLAAGIALMLLRLDLFVISLFAAYILGAGVAVVLLLRQKKTLQSAVPFGPFLAMGAGVALVCGECILKVML